MCIPFRRGVVRCRECKHFEIDAEDETLFFCNKHIMVRNKHDWYCADGERKVQGCTSGYNKTYGSGRKARSDGMKLVWKRRRAET